jgi:hypothetical protein
MLRLRLLLSLLALLCVVAFAASPVGTLTSSGVVQVNGKGLPNTGAPNWPIASGDEVFVVSGSAVIALAGGERVTLPANSRIALKVCDSCVLQLFAGSAGYAVPQGSKFQICALGRPVRLAGEGSVAIEGPEKVVVNAAGKNPVDVGPGKCACDAGAFWTSGKKAAVLVAAGGAATAATIAVRKPDKRSKKDK